MMMHLQDQSPSEVHSNELQIRTLTVATTNCNCSFYELALIVLSVPKAALHDYID